MTTKSTSTLINQICDTGQELDFVNADFIGQQKRLQKHLFEEMISIKRLNNVKTRKDIEHFSTAY